MKKGRIFYANFLTALLMLFLFRVFAQFLQAVYPVTFLPDFDVWHSGALPYSALLFFQFIITGVCGLTVWRFKTRPIAPNKNMGYVCLVLGVIYFTLMALRLIAGFSFAGDHPWLGAHLPALFHLVLASFVLVVGFYHSGALRSLVARLAYPVIMLSALAIHYVSTFNGVNIYLATYMPVLLAAVLISYLEIKLPYRPQWRPSANEAKDDAGYMLLVQILLPRFLGFLVVMVSANVYSSNVSQQTKFISTLWPHNSSVAFQAMLMLLFADFLRYWLHRLSHACKPLWKLHEVHHSPKKLYWMNVGRFHPLEKGLQYVFDALPFIVLGVSQEVLALYFVFYAINGFFQHCNIDLRLGILNYVVSGPELHRWHHSKHIDESDNNFGNNLIIWDWLFSTRYLPKNRSVETLGVLNDNYPSSLFQQLASPFINTEKSK